MKDCVLIKDLFPLYKEELLKEEAAKILKVHFKECENCRKGYERYCKKEQEKEEIIRKKQEEKDRGFLKLLRSYRRRFRFLVGTLAILTVTLSTLLFLFAALVINGGWAKRSKDIADYPEILTKEQNMRTGFFVFPKTLGEEIVDSTFDYYYKDTLFDPTISVFLQVIYKKEGYEAEVKRLEEVKKTQSGEVKLLLRDDGENYPYSTYIAVENHCNSYEYALLSGKHQITYIYTLHVPREEIEFDTKYLPSDFMTEEGRAFGSGYSIYRVNKGESMITYDYNREE